MSQLNSRSRFPPSQPPSGGYSSGSSHASSMGHDSSMGFSSAVQEQGSRYNDSQYPNLPSNVKLPPSYQGNQADYRPQPMSRQAPQSHDSGSTMQNAVSKSMSRGGGERSVSSGAVPVADIVKKLNFASEENVRLRKVLHDSNDTIESKLQEIEQCLANSKKLKEENERLESQIKDLTTQHTEATNKFFEARVAVLGYKCRTMQLDGELKEMKESGNLHKGQQPHSMTVPNDAHLQQHIRALEAENKQLKQAQPGGASAAAFQRLQREKYEIEAEKKNLATIVAQLNSDLEEVKAKKDAARRDGSMLSQQLDQLNAEFRSMQAQCSKLMGDVQEATQQKGIIEGQLRDEKRRSDDLRRKVNELEESRSTLQNKLQKQSHEHPMKQKPPTPKPRTNLQGISIQVKEQLESEKREIQTQLDQEKELRSTVESRLLRERQKMEEMIQKQNRLENEVVSLRSDLELKQRQELTVNEELQTLRVQASSGSSDKVLAESLQKNIERRDKHITSLNEEKSSLQSRIAQLEKTITEQRQELSVVRDEKRREVTKLKQDKDMEISKLEDQLQKLSLKPPEVEASTPVATPRGKQTGKQLLAIRLDTAMGTIKEKKAEIERLQKELAEKGTLDDQNIKLLQEEVEGYKRKLQSSENQVAELEHQVADYAQEESRLVTESLRLTDEKDRLYQQLSMKDGALRETENTLSSVQRELSEKRRESEQLGGELAQVQSQLTVEAQTKDEHSQRVKFLEDKLCKLQDQYSKTQSQLQALRDEKQGLQTRVHELHKEREEISKEKAILIDEKADAETAVSEFQKESESILKDYDTCAQQLQVVTKEKDKLHAELTMMTNEASKRGDRVKQLEQQRDDALERLTHMDEQLKIYHEDFDREREAREAAIKVKSLAEERMKKMEKDMKDLRERLNQQAARRLQEDPYDDPPQPQLRRSGEQQFGGPHHLQMGGVHSQYNDPPQPQLRRPDEQQFGGPPQPQLRRSGEQQFGGPPQPQLHRSGEQQFGGPPQPQLRRSGEQQFIQQQLVPEPAPPIPPRERPGPQQGGGGGGGYPANQFHPPNIRGGGDVPWTMQQPPMVQSSGRVHPMTVNQGRPIPQPRIDTQNDLNQQPPLRAVAPVSMAPAQMPLNDLNMPPQTTIGIPGQQAQGRYASPGEVMNAAPPMTACPLCHKRDFKTQTDLELHCAQCTAD